MLKRILPLKLSRRQTTFVPAYKPPDEKDYDAIRLFIKRHQRILVLTGAGISTESGS